VDTVEAIRDAASVMSTADRIDGAWDQAHSVTRRAFVAAVVTSGAAGWLLPTPWIMRVTAAGVGTLLASAALVDTHERKLPNRLLGAAGWLALAGPVAAFDPAMCARALAGGGIGGMVMLAVCLTRGVGMGDVKMAAVVGAGTGAFTLAAAPLAIAIAALSATTYGLLARRRALVLGPSLWLGWAAAMLALSSGWWS
jgi:leader peptidase (prepilin peptidase)/N-methyltransferase